MNSLKEVKRIIARGRCFSVTSHVYPDGDAIGSMIALARLLREMGRETHAINPAVVPPGYRFLDRAGEIEVYRAAHESILSGCDALFILDASTNDRLGPLHEISKRLRLPRVCLDHHPDNIVDADIKVVDQRACSTAQLVYDLYHEFGCEIGEEAADALYAAIHTDTVSFNFLGTGPRTHEIAADLLRRGVDPKKMWMNIYGRESPGLLKLAGRALARLRTEEGGRIAWIEVRESDWRELGVDPHETEAFTRYPLTLDGVGAIALFCEESCDRTRVSLRALDGTDMGEIARSLGGGGHRTSAGATVTGPLERVVGRVIKALREAAR